MKFRPLAALVALMLVPAVSVQTAEANVPPTFLLKWGSNGTADGQFNYPVGIAVDSVGNVYETDGDNHRIQKFSSDGTFLMKWGSRGTGDGQFNYPVGVALGPDGNVYVVDHFNHRIQVFTTAGMLIRKWGSQGSGDGRFSFPEGIGVDIDVHALSPLLLLRRHRTQILIRGPLCSQRPSCRLRNVRKFV